MQPLDPDLTPLVRFDGPDKPTWEAVDDTVMGGLSDSRITYTDAGTAVFSGTVSLANNGGFASARFVLGGADWRDYTTLVLRLKGDGLRYAVNVRPVDAVRMSYRFYLETTGDWETIRLPFADLVPMSVGELVPDAPPLDLSAVQFVGFMVTGGQDGPFRLELAWVGGA